MFATTALEELKLRATHLVVAVCCVGLSCYLCFFELCVLTLTPLDNVCFLDLTEAFAVTMMVVLFFTSIFIVPVVCFHGWGFVSPGLTGPEKFAWASRLATSPAWLLISLLMSFQLSHLLCVWFLGYSLGPAEKGDGLVLQYLPLISGFVWFKFKCFVCVAGSLAGLQALSIHGAPQRYPFGPSRDTEIEWQTWIAMPIGASASTNGFGVRSPRASRPARGWIYSGAVLLGAFFAAGAPQLVLSLCIIMLCEMWFLSSYIKAQWPLRPLLAGAQGTSPKRIY